MQLGVGWGRMLHACTCEVDASAYKGQQLVAQLRWGAGQCCVFETLVNAAAEGCSIFHLLVV